MIAGIRPTATSRPLTSPQARPIADRDQRDDDDREPVVVRERGCGQIGAQSPTIDPTLRSMFRVRTTIVSPTATTTTIATSVAMSCQFADRREVRRADREEEDGHARASDDPDARVARSLNAADSELR